MSGHAPQRAFTLVEILIVVIILGVLAALVVPQFTSAATDSMKTAILRQMQEISNQVELYRANNSGRFPTDDLDDPMVEGGSWSGWGALVGPQYLREEPRNSYTVSALLMSGTAADAVGADRSSGVGWYYEVTPAQVQVHPAGFDPVNHLFHHELPEE